jgi:hypothetical protein
MEREFESNSSHLCTSRTSLWCPICGAQENRGCTEAKHGGLRIAYHNAVVTGTVPRPVITPEKWEPAAVKKDAPKKGWSPKGWQ